MKSIRTVMFLVGLLTLIPYSLTDCQNPPPDSITNLILFKIERNMVIVPVSINGAEPYDLILDTGMGFDGVYLFREEFASEIDTSGALEVRAPGAGSDAPSKGFMVENGILRFGDITVDSQRVVILQSEYTKGFIADGVIGWNLFGHYTVEIDYDSGMIILHDSDTFQADTSWQTLPIELKGNLPFFKGELEVIEGENIPLTLFDR